MIVIFTLELREKGVGTTIVSLAIRLLGRPGGCGCEPPHPPKLKCHCTSLFWCELMLFD